MTADVYVRALPRSCTSSLDWKAGANEKKGKACLQSAVDLPGAQRNKDLVDDSRRPKAEQGDGDIGYTVR